MENFIFRAVGHFSYNEIWLQMDWDATHDENQHHNKGIDMEEVMRTEY